MRLDFPAETPLQLKAISFECLMTIVLVTAQRGATQKSSLQANQKARGSRFTGAPVQRRANGRAPLVRLPTLIRKKHAQICNQSGPQNVFFNNVMQKAHTPEGELEDFTPVRHS